MTELDIPANSAPDCLRFHERLLSYLERDLDTEDLAWMEHHRAQCTACVGLVRDLDEVVEQARALPTFAPSRDLWAGIEPRLETPILPLSSLSALADVARTPLVVTAPAAPVPERHPFLTVKRFAIAASLLMAVTTAVTWQIARTEIPVPEQVTVADSGMDGMVLLPVTNASVAYQTEIDALREIVSQRYTELDSTTVATLERNLDIIDNAIDECRTALQQDPNSRFLSTILDQALESKLAFMRRVALL